MAKHDWVTIRREYVEGYDDGGHVLMPTMAVLATRHNVAPAMVRREAMAGKWADDRNTFLTKVKQAREEKRTTLLATEGAAFDKRMLRFSAALMKLIDRSRRGIGMAKGAPDPLELSRVGLAARHAQTIAKVALGESDADIPLPAPGNLVATIRVAYQKVPLPGESG